MSLGGCAADHTDHARRFACGAHAALRITATTSIASRNSSRPARGKRGGVRVIYYWLRKRYQVLMLLIYPKSARDDLTADERKLLAKLVEQELADG